MTDLIRDLPVGKRIVMTALSTNKIVDVVLVEKISLSKLSIDLYEAKLCDAPVPAHEHDWYLRSLVELLEAVQMGAFGEGDMDVTFHYVATSVDVGCPVKFDASYACQYPPEYMGALGKPPTIGHMEDLLRQHRVSLNSPRCHGTQEELEALLTRPLMLLFPW